MGGRLKLLLSGSAPISREVLHLLRAGMGALIVEGYGTTETGASGCSTVEGDISPGTVLQIIIVIRKIYCKVIIECRC